MLVYKDIITEDELFSDAFKPVLVDDIVYEVDTKMITVKDGDVDIGANPSAEDQEEGVDSTEQKVNNLVHSHRLVNTSFDKKSYMGHIKDYMKAIERKLPEERKAAFKAGAATYVKKIIGSIGDYEFYIGENMNPEGMVALLNYRDDGVTPYFIFWRDGLKEEKY